MRRPILAISALPLLAAAPPTAAPIEIVISGIRSNEGMVLVSVCPEDRFMKECRWTGRAAARPGEVKVIVPNVPPGRYAIQAFHDADGDGKLRAGLFGIPREGIGFSNDAMAHLQRPRFSVAAFTHGSEPQHMAVRLRYFLG